MVQKYYVRPASEASPILPASIALVNDDDGSLLGQLEDLPEKATVKEVAAAYNALVVALRQAHLADAPGDGAEEDEDSAEDAEE
jgi:hypothetical protein